MPLLPVSSLDDPRLSAYRHLKDRALDRTGRLFIAEGEYVVRQLLASDFPVESAFLSERRAAEMAALFPPGVPVYVAPRPVMSGLMGMKFQSGVAACGRRKPRQSIDDVVPRDRPRLTLAVGQDVSNVENVGSLVRLAVAFGADALILGERCHDPFWRQAIRVSMGTVFCVPLVQTDDLLRDLSRLRAEWGVQLAATVLDADAESLASATRPARFGLLFGNEAHGLDAATAAACDRRVTIPMRRGADSLNVAVAAGIFLYHFTREEFGHE